MKPVEWKKWAAIAEVIGTAAVVISLIFVGVSIRQNSAVVSATQENFLYDLNDRYLSDQISNPEMYEIWRKAISDEPLTYEEEWRLTDQIIRALNNWENFYIKYKSGLLSEEQFLQWHEANLEWMKSDVPESFWKAIGGPQWRLDFEDQIDAVYAGDQE